MEHLSYYSRQNNVAIAAAGQYSGLEKRWLQLCTAVVLLSQMSKIVKHDRQSLRQLKNLIVVAQSPPQDEKKNEKEPTTTTTNTNGFHGCV
jgi:hypothetical protein